MIIDHAVTGLLMVDQEDVWLASGCGPNLYCQEYSTKLVRLRDGYYLHGLVVGRYVK